MVVYLPAEDRYIIHSPVQRAHPYRNEIAKVMKVPESKVRVICIDVGGSFGMKTPVFNEAPLTMFASKLTGRAVKWMSTRTEAFLSDAQARDNVTEAELALDKDGTFLGFRVKTIAAIGAYLQNNMPAFILNAGTLAGVYRTPAMHVDITGVFTNTNPVRPYRGNGRPEAGYVIERMVDLAADELGLDPAELRRRNYISPQQMPFKTGLTFTYDCGEFEKNMDLALELADFKGFKRRREDSRKRGKLPRLRYLQHHRARGRRRHRGRRSAFRPRRHRDPVFRIDHRRPGPRNRIQTTGVRPARIASRRSPLRAGRHRRGVLRRRHRRLAHIHDVQRGVYDGDRQGDRKSQGDRSPCTQGRCRGRELCRRRVLVRRKPTRP